MKQCSLYDNFGPRLKELIFSKGFNSAEFAKKCGVCDNTIYRYINGAREPSFLMLETMSDALGVEVYELFKFDESEK